MGNIKCISRLMILCGSGLRPGSFCYARVASFSLLFLLSLSPAAYAQNYTFTMWPFGASFSSANDACQQAASSNQSAAITAHPAPTQYNCTTTRFSDNYQETLYVSVSGDSCPTGTTFNDSLGSCGEPDNKCAILKGTAIPSFKFKSTADAPTGTISKNGCAVQLGTGICVTRTAPLYDCTFSGTVTGEKLDIQNGTSTSDCAGSQCHDGEPQKEVTDNPCDAIPAGSGFTCTSSKSEDTPGKSQCGTANGAYVCVDNPKPSSSASVTKTEQTSTSNADGSTTTKTTNTTTTTVCKGIRNCSTGTTTTVVVGGTNANGTTKPPSSTCTGPECGGGKVDAPGNGGGSGNSGAGEGEEGEDEQDTVSGDMQCETVVACSGDVIQCAVLRQEQQSRCADKDFRDLSDAKTKPAIDSMNSDLSGADFQPLKLESDNTYDMSKLIDTSSRFGSSCPVLSTVSYSWVDGSSGQFDPNVDGLCDFLKWFGYLMVAFATRRAAQIIATGAA